MTDICYKMTNADMQTYNGFQWSLGEWVETSGEGWLCGSGWIHVFETPELAVWVCQGLVTYRPTRLFRCECGGRRLDGGTFKRGYTRVRLVEELPLPEIPINAQIRASIIVAQKVWSGRSAGWDAWAEKWLSGKDRSHASARAAVYDIDIDTSYVLSDLAAAAARCAAHAANVVGDAIKINISAAAAAANAAAAKAIGDAVEINFPNTIRQAIKDEASLTGEA